MERNETNEELNLDDSQCLCGKKHLPDSEFCQECEDMMNIVAYENDYEDDQP